MATTTATSTTPVNPYANLNQAIPGLPNLTGTASNDIQSLLSGNVSPSITRNAAATFGVQNGLGTGSGVTNRYGYDLYKNQGRQNQQMGIQDLLGLVGGYSGTVAPSAGQNLQNTQFQQQLAQQANEFNQSQQQQLLQLLAQLAG